MKLNELLLKTAFELSKTSGYKSGEDFLMHTTKSYKEAKRKPIIEAYKRKLI
jgi:hypothetical protein